MMYLSIVAKPDSVILLEKEMIEAGVIKYTLQVVLRKSEKPKEGYESLEEEIKALIKEEMGKKTNVEAYITIGKEIDLHKFVQRGQFKIIHISYRDDTTNGIKHIIVTNATAFIMNNDGKTIDSVSAE